ncbi:hypothetical protein ASPBRDRAFT_46071 [Aspergillus brasiliensis CBS 101740]|uniref:Uncharacterized protein n=1 Tax=Aspergillus brasiliensis (strain CBS 101740 / IMI 381727 / IBT 21946) TaxID=767769 RepID=A0A1L9UDI9_ASPBC|nr:hypothetical protein ASPBRDRAFT_46071 [Aspergillus brasiliensis CBS 101740]
MAASFCNAVPRKEPGARWTQIRPIAIDRSRCMCQEVLVMKPFCKNQRLTSNLMDGIPIPTSNTPVNASLQQSHRYFQQYSEFDNIAVYIIYTHAKVGC